MSVDAEVLYVGGPLLTNDTELRLNSVRGYNRWLSDYASHAPDRLLGMAAIPIDTPLLTARSVASGRLSGNAFSVGSQRPDSANGCIRGLGMLS